MSARAFAILAILASSVVTSAWSQIAFVTNERGNLDIAVASDDGRSYTMLTTSDDHEAAPAWAPDGASLTYTANSHGNIDIYRMAADAGSVVQLTESPDQDAESAWSPDGSRIAFSSDRTGTWDVWVMSADGGDVRQLTTHAAIDWCPTWSPDGSEIAFTGARLEAPGRVRGGKASARVVHCHHGSQTHGPRGLRREIPPGLGTEVSTVD